MSSEGVAIAAQTARALAIVLAETGRRLPLSSKVGRGVRGQAYVISAVLAPRVLTAADVAAIGAAISSSADDMATDIDDPAALSSAFYDAATASVEAVPSFTSSALTRAAAIGRALAGCAEATFLGHAFAAEARTSFGDRQSAIAARRRISGKFDASLDRIALVTGQAVVEVLSQVARIASDHIANVAANLQPIVRVATARSAPSTAVAFALYGDPARAPELVSRNRVATPLFMPTTLDALSPQA